MSKATSIVERFTFGRRALVFAALAMASLGGTAPVAAQDAADETVGERLKEYWAKAIAKMESGARATGDEYHKVKEEAAKASGPAREKLAAEMESPQQEVGDRPREARHDRRVADALARRGLQGPRGESRQGDGTGPREDERQAGETP